MALVLTRREAGLSACSDRDPNPNPCRDASRGALSPQPSPWPWQDFVFKPSSDKDHAKIVCSAEAFDALQEHVNVCNAEMSKVADIQGNGLQQAGANPNPYP